MLTRTVKVEVAALISGQHADIGSIHDLPVDEANTLMRHKIVSEIADDDIEAAKKTEADAAAAQAKADADAAKPVK
jgi:hypothetical protein